MTYSLPDWCRIRTQAEMLWHRSRTASPIARFMGPTWGPSGADRTQVGPMLAPLTSLSGLLSGLLAGMSKSRTCQYVNILFGNTPWSIICTYMLVYTGTLSRILSASLVNALLMHVIHMCMLGNEIDMHVTNLSCYRIQLCIAVQRASNRWDVPSHARLFLEQLVYSDKQHIKATHFWLLMMKIHWWSMDFPLERASAVKCGPMSWREIWLVLLFHFSCRSSKLLTQQLVCTKTERITKAKHRWLFVRRIH